MFPSCQLSQALVRPQQVRLQLVSCSWGQAFLSRIECSGIFQYYLFCRSSGRSWGEFFSLVYCWDSGQALGGATYSSTAPPPHILTGSLGCATHRVVYSRPPGICQLQFRFSTLILIFTAVSTYESLLWDCDYLYPPVCLSNLGGSDLSCVLTSLKDPKRVADISVCSGFSSCLDGVTTSKLLACRTRNQWSNPI